MIVAIVSPVCNLLGVICLTNWSSSFWRFLFDVFQMLSVQIFLARVSACRDSPSGHAGWLMARRIVVAQAASFLHWVEASLAPACSVDVRPLSGRRTNRGPSDLPVKATASSLVRLIMSMNSFSASSYYWAEESLTSSLEESALSLQLSE